MTGRDRTGGATLALGAVAAMVVCCAGLPLVAGAVAGMSLAAAAGAGVGGLLVIAAAAAALGVIRRRRRTCRPAGRREGMV